MLPSRLQLWGWGVVVTWAFLGAVWEWGAWFALIPFFGWLVLLLVSGWLVWRMPPVFAVSRVAERVAAVGKDYAMLLKLQNISHQEWQVAVYDHYPDDFISEEMPVSFVLPKNGVMEVCYKLVPQTRGLFEFSGVQLRYQRPLSLWVKNIVLAERFTGSVYPKFASYQRQGFVSIAKNIHGVTHTLTHLQGQGDFEYLRDYQVGDALKHIDYKAMARLGKPVTKVFSLEHEQPVALLLDQSRRMQGMFDEALSAAVALAKAAMYQGDAVSVQTFSSRENLWLPLGRHGAQYAKLMETFSHLQADDYPPDYFAACEAFYRRQRQRTLVILLTVLQAEDGKALRKSIRLLKRRHDVVLVSLRPPYLDTPIVVKDLQTAASVGARDSYTLKFEAMQKTLKAEKIRFIACQPQQLSAQIVNAYLQFKRGAI